MSAHVLVARLDNLGDVLLAGPAVRAVAGGAGRVTFLAGPRGADAARLLPGVDEVVVFDAPWVGYEPAAAGRPAMEGLIDIVRSLGVDAAVILTSDHQSPLPLALLLRMAGVPLIAGISHDHPGSLLDVRASLDPALHEVEQALDLVGRIGYVLPAGDDGSLSIGFDRQRLRGSDSYVVVHPGATAAARAIDVGRAGAIVRALDAAGHQVVVTGGATEARAVKRVASAGSGARALAGEHDLGGLATVLRDAAVVVAGNTGPAHLAAAVGTPVVSVFAPVVPWTRWKPWAVPTVVLGDLEITCRGCRSLVCPLDGQPCLAPATPEAVVAAVAALSRTPSGATT
jgi:ADP-heptose:LPS heptosyltransferase